MEQTRSSLSDKLELLEQKVSDTVQVAATAVTDTVETVKESVEATVDSVKETLNLSLHVQRHPWAMVSGAAAVGFLGGWLLTSARRSEAAPTHSAAPPVPRDGQTPALPKQPAAEQSSWLGSLLRTFVPDLEKLKGLAIGAAAGMVRDLILEQTADDFKPYLTEKINDLTANLGGQVIPGPVLGRPQSRTGSSSESAS